MSTKEGQPATKKQTNSSDVIVVDPAVIRDAVLLSEDVLMLIFSFTDFVTLIRVKRICMYWKMMVCRTFPFILGSKPFETKEKLFGTIREHCGNKMLCADKIARLHGWPTEKWGVSEIDDFEDAFEDLVDFNEDIGEWDIASNATNPSVMFWNARSFNQDLSRWNTSKVTDMECMFYRATSFNQNISLWDVSNVVNKENMFVSAESFNNDFAPQFLL